MRKIFRAKKSILTALLLLLLPLASQAEGGAVGNGGNGLIIAGTPYVLDLVEAGVERNPYFDNNVKINPRLLAQVKKYLPQFPEIADRLASKLSEIEVISPVTAWLIVEAFRLYTYRLVDESLVNIHDDDSVVDYPSANLVQLAIRRSKTIFINGRWWPALAIDQKVALLIHEMAYAYQGRGSDTFVRQSSVVARALVGFIFTTDIRDRGYEGLLLALHDGSRLYPAAAWLRSPIAEVRTSVLETTLQPQSLSLYRFSQDSNSQPTGSPIYLGEVSTTTPRTKLATACLIPPGREINGNLGHMRNKPSIEFASDPADGLVVNGTSLISQNLYYSRFSYVRPDNIKNIDVSSELILSCTNSLTMTIERAFRD